MLVLPLMAYFNRDSRGGGRDFNRDSRGGGDRGSFNRGPRRPSEMFHAVCSKCGQDCQVPFRPSSDKPVYCSNCFDRDTTPRRENTGDRNESRSNFRSERPSYSDRSSSQPSFRSEGPRESFHAVCANCGKDCTLPFEPRTNKPVYCSNCFEKNGGDSRKTEQRQPAPQDNEKLDALNAKLDKILELLGAEIEVEPAAKPEVKTKAEPVNAEISDSTETTDNTEPTEGVAAESPAEVEVATEPTLPSEAKPEKVRKSSKKSA